MVTPPKSILSKVVNILDATFIGFTIHIMTCIQIETQI
jgi:hypothetical protein